MYVNHLGSVAALTNSGGALVGCIIRYEPYGAYRGAPPSATQEEITDRGFTGHRDNRELGLVYMNARYYVPEVGRFASPDTIVPDPGNPQSFNRYSYALNSPSNYTDPSGHMPTNGCGYEACNLPLGLSSGATWQSSGGVLTPWDPIAASAQDYNPVTQAAIPGAVGIVGVAVVPALAGAVVELAGPAAGSAATAACADGDCTNDLDYFARAAEYGVRSARDLRNLIKGTELQAHHIVEQRFASGIGANTREMLSVALTPEEHQQFTNAWRQAIGYINSNSPITTANATVSDIWQAAQRIYSDYPSLLEAARITLFNR